MNQQLCGMSCCVLLTDEVLLGGGVHHGRAVAGGGHAGLDDGDGGGREAAAPVFLLFGGEVGEAALDHAEEEGPGRHVDALVVVQKCGHGLARDVTVEAGCVELQGSGEVASPVVQVGHDVVDGCDEARARLRAFSVDAWACQSIDSVARVRRPLPYLS